jgi:hypothetical protein
MSLSVPMSQSRRDDLGVAAAALILRFWWIAAALWLAFSLWTGWSIWSLKH